MLAKVIACHSRSEQLGDRIFLVRSAQCGLLGADNNWSRRFQSRQPCKFVRRCSHLCTQPVEDGKSSFFGARCKIARGANTRRTSLLAFTGVDKLSSFLHQQIMREKKRFGKADAAGIHVVKIQIWLEKLRFMQCFWRS